MSALNLFNFPQRDRTPARRDWSQQELAEFYRVEAALIQAGIRLATDRGLSDEGDPWFVFCREETGDPVVHLARIDGEYVIASEALEQISRGRDFRQMVQSLIDRHRATTPLASPIGGKVSIHPAALLIAFVGVALLKTAQPAKAGQLLPAGGDGVRKVVLNSSGASLPAPLFSGGSGSADTTSEPVNAAMMLIAAAAGVLGGTNAVAAMDQGSAPPIDFAGSTPAGGSQAIDPQFVPIVSAIVASNAGPAVGLTADHTVQASDVFGASNSVAVVHGSSDPAASGNPSGFIFWHTEAPTPGSLPPDPNAHLNASIFDVARGDVQQAQLAQMQVHAIFNSNGSTTATAPAPTPGGQTGVIHENAVLTSQLPTELTYAISHGLVSYGAGAASAFLEQQKIVLDLNASGGDSSPTPTSAASGASGIGGPGYISVLVGSSSSTPGSTATLTPEQFGQVLHAFLESAADAKVIISQQTYVFADAGAHTVPTESVNLAFSDGSTISIVGTQVSVDHILAMVH